MSTELTPQQVASALDSEGIKNRVVIVSACFSGIFVPPLQNDNTIVMTASDDKSTSFGCAPERDWTYFGDALFQQSLQPGTDFQQAFDHARVLIQRLGADGPRAAVQSARPFRSGAGAKARAIIRAPAARAIERYATRVPPAPSSLATPTGRDRGGSDRLAPTELMARMR